jgi:hypothetical protein
LPYASIAARITPEQIGFAIAHTRAMSGKSGKRITGNKPASSTRTSAKTDGAFGKEQVDQLVFETERNTDKAVSRKIKLPRT